MHLLRQGRLGESDILKEATRKLVLTRVSHFRIIHQMSLNSGIPVADAQLTAKRCCLLNSEQHNGWRTQEPMNTSHFEGKTSASLCRLKISFLGPHEVVKKRDVTFRTTKFINH